MRRRCFSGPFPAIALNNRNHSKALKCGVLRVPSETVCLPMKGNTSVLVVALLVTSSLAVLFGSLSPQVKALTGGPDAYGYTFDDTAPYSWIPAAGVIVADDPTNSQSPGGGNDFLFGNFNFYGVGYAGIIVCPNGFVKFTGALNTGTTSNSNLPN